MAKPPTSVRSIRLPDEVWDLLKTRSAKTGKSVNELVAGGVRWALQVTEPLPDVIPVGQKTMALIEEAIRGPEITPSPFNTFRPHPKPGKR